MKNNTRTRKKNDIRTWKRTVLSSAIALAASTVNLPTSLYAAEVCDGAGPHTLSGAQLDNQCTLEGTEQVTLESGGFLLYPRAAINVLSDTDVIITNEGSILSLGGSSSLPFIASGVVYQNTQEGMLTNNGSIQAILEPTNPDDPALAYAVYVYDGIYGTISNSGTISSIASSSTISYGDLVGAVGISGGYLGSNGSITNTVDGEISAIAGTQYGSIAIAKGIRIYDDLEGNITNAGEITALSYGDIYASAYGIEVGSFFSGPGDIYGTIQNDGSINIDAQSYGESAIAIGIAGGELYGAINNTSNLTIAFNVSATGSAYGAGIDVGNVSGTINNTGTINGTVTSYDGIAEGYGIHTANVNDGAWVSNSGTINLDVLSYGEVAAAIGIFAEGVSTYGSIDNSGTINLDVLSYGQAAAIGIFAEGVDGSINNTSDLTINFNVSASGVAYGAGIEVGNVNGTINNTGTINGTVTSYNDWAEGYGITTDNVGYGALVSNSGTIDLMVNAAGSGGWGFDALGAGIQTGHINGTVENSGGDINVTTISGDDQAEAYGILGGNLTLYGQVNNINTINSTFNATTNITTNTTINATMTITATGTEALAGGIDLGYSEGSVTNYGSITVMATARDEVSGDDAWNGNATARGIHVDDLEFGLVRNNGSITVTANTTANFTASNPNADARGIDAGNIAFALVLNDFYGSLTVSANSLNGDAAAYGIETDDFGFSDIYSEGSMTVTANSSLGNASAYGIETGDWFAEGFVVTGAEGGLTITANSLYGDAAAYGISTGNVTDGPIFAEGNMTVTSDSLYGNASAYGIETGNLSGLVFAEGSSNITVTATTHGDWPDDSDAMAAGIYVGDIDSNEGVGNAGMINVTATADNSGAEAYGIQGGDMYEGASIINANYDEYGNLVTNGTTAAINVMATGTDALARGISLEGTDGFAEGTVLNYGSITVTATARDEVSGGDAWSGNAQAQGIYTPGVFPEGSVWNYGTIDVTATTNANASGDLVSAYAAGIDVDYIDGTVNNQNNITVTAAVTGLAEGFAEGFGITSGNVWGDVTNNGTITVTANHDTQWGIATAFGIDVYDIYGTVSNSGTLTVNATSYGNASATGIEANFLFGTINNSSPVPITVNATGESAWAAGIELYEDIEDGGTINNTGSIGVTATATDGDATAHGIIIEDIEYGGLITNSGSIEVTAHAFLDDDNDAFASGIDARRIDGEIENSNILNVTAISNDDAAEAYGILGGYSSSWADVENDGVIMNTANGTITISAAGTEAVAHGISVNDVSGSISNYGTITVGATARDELDSLDPAYWGSASARGIDTSTVYGSVTNNGMIDVTATTTVMYGDADARGIDVGDIYGDVINDNEIIAYAANLDATAYYGEVDAYGIEGSTVWGDGLVANYGTINVTASTGGDFGEADAYGIELSTIYGTVINDNQITVSALDASNGGSAESYGIEGGTVYGAVLNYGTIAVTANATGYEGFAGAFGIELSSIYGQVINTNNITVTATASGTDATAVAYGIEGSTVYGTVSNDGTINVTATATGDGGAAVAYGIELGEIYYGDVTNTSALTIEFNVTGDSFAEGYGIEADDILFGSINNTGTITGTVTANNGWAEGWGIQVDDLTDSWISNSGTIDITVTGGDGGAFAYGIESKLVDSSSSIVNEVGGQINATATSLGGSSDWAVAGGIYAEGGSGVSGQLINNGTITANATGPNAGAFGMGADIVNSGGQIVNNNVITATANGWASASYATGIGVRGSLDAGGMVINNGTITATLTGTASDFGNNNGGAYSIWAEGAGDVYNNDGATLNGNLWLDGTINMYNNGTFNASVGRPGELGDEQSYIGGDYVQAGTGIYNVEIYSDTEFTTLDIAGQADISANQEIGVNVTGFISDGTEFLDVLSSTDLVYAGNITAVSSSPLYTFTALEVGGDDNIDLTVSAITLTELAGARIRSAIGVAGALEQIGAAGPTGDLGTLLTTIVTQPTLGEIADAITELVPTLDGGASVITAEAARGLTRAVRARLRMRGGLSSGDSMYKDQNFWVKPYYHNIDQNMRDRVPGYDMDAWGIAFGADAEISNTWRVGLGAAFTRSDFDRDYSVGSNEVDADTIQIGLYGDYRIDADTTLKMQGAFGWTDYDSRRDITFLGETAKADFDSTHLRLTADYEMTSAWSPSTDVTYKIFGDYTYVDVDSYRESGSIASLDVSSDTEDELIIGAGVQWDYRATEASVLTTNLELGVDLLADRTILGSRFVAGGPSFTTDALKPSPIVFRGGIGYSMLTDSDVEVSARYDLEAREDFADQAFSVNVRWKF